jgi:putative ABC transport system ATP-binding protein
VPTHYDLKAIQKKFPGRTVFDGFDLKIEKGEQVAITGPSGCGKSTLLNMMGLLEKPDHGEIRILGRPAPRPRGRAANRQLRHHIGYLFQNFALIDDASVKQNLDIALTYAGRGPSRKERIAEALRHVGLPGMEERRVFSLSGGEQQRVAVARLLLKPCDVILADEPTGALDTTNRDIVLGLLTELNRAGKTVVIATHDQDVMDACSRVVPLRKAGISWGPAGPTSSPTVAAMGDRG